MTFYCDEFNQVYLFNIEIENIHLVHQRSWAFFNINTATSNAILDLELHNLFVNDNYSMYRFIHLHLHNNNLSMNPQEAKYILEALQSRMWILHKLL